MQSQHNLLQGSTVYLPMCLAPYKTPELVRVGQNNDGGYLVDSRSIDHATVLLSFGVNEDWSFESQFSTLNKSAIYAYDASVNTSTISINRSKIMAVIKKPYGLTKWRTLLNSNNVLRSYKEFFQGNHKHIEKFLGDKNCDQYVTLTDVINSLSVEERKNILLKIDIEGAEYSILDDIIKHADCLVGFIVEFHGLEHGENLSKIQSFIERFSLKLVHTHVNNYSLGKSNGKTCAIECTFTSYDVKEEKLLALPHELDQPCSPEFSEYQLRFNDMYISEVPTSDR